ncbi:MAG TPA: hypothetical protein VM286_08285 [Candidatus Thermoplasmatota archaeon]|nr:hypothetical protein [Candidatus Thermoplasmatota archaeon]
MPAIAPLRAARAPAGTPLPRDAADLRAGLAEGRWSRDARPAFYFVEATGPRGPMRGFLALLATAGAPPMPATGTGPAVLRYTDPRGWVEELLSSNAFDEVARLHEPDGGQRLWRVDRAEAVGELVAQFEDRALALLRPPGPHPPGAVMAFLVRDPAWLPVQPGGAIAAVEDEPVPRPWAGDAGPPQWRPPPL